MFSTVTGALGETTASWGGSLSVREKAQRSFKMGRGGDEGKGL